MLHISFEDNGTSYCPYLTEALRSPWRVYTGVWSTALTLTCLYWCMRHCAHSDVFILVYEALRILWRVYTGVWGTALTLTCLYWCMRHCAYSDMLILVYEALRLPWSVHTGLQSTALALNCPYWSQSTALTLMCPYWSTKHCAYPEVPILVYKALRLPWSAQTGLRSTALTLKCPYWSIKHCALSLKCWFSCCNQRLCLLPCSSKRWPCASKPCVTSWPNDEPSAP